jgi:hypothetical protein
MQFQKRYPTHDIVPCFVRLKSLKVIFRSDSQIFDEIIRGKVKEMATCLLQNSLHAKVDIILKTESTPGIEFCQILFFALILFVYCYVAFQLK